MKLREFAKRLMDCDASEKDITIDVSSQPGVRLMDAYKIKDIIVEGKVRIILEPWEKVITNEEWLNEQPVGEYLRKHAINPKICNDCPKLLKINNAGYCLAAISGARCPNREKWLKGDADNDSV